MKTLQKNDSVMNNNITRRIAAAMILGTGLTLSACGGSGSNAAKPSNGASNYEVAGDHVIGNPDATVTVVEYASVVCGACANFHTTVYPDFKKKYIDSGKVRFVFREFPTAPETLAQTGFLIARCANETKYFENISLQFKRQRQIFKAANNGTVRDEYLKIAKSAGLSEDEFYSCVTSEDNIAALQKVYDGGTEAGVRSTPSFLVNGELVTKTANYPQLFTIESFDEYLAPLLGEEAPPANAPAAAETDKPTKDAQPEAGE